MFIPIHNNLTVKIHSHLQLSWSLNRISLLNIQPCFYTSETTADIFQTVKYYSHIHTHPSLLDYLIAGLLSEGYLYTTTDSERRTVWWRLLWLIRLKKILSWPQNFRSVSTLSPVLSKQQVCYWIQNLRKYHRSGNKLIAGLSLLRIVCSILHSLIQLHI